MATIGALYRRVDGFNASMYGFWDYWKHDILIQIGLAKSEDCWPTSRHVDHMVFIADLVSESIKFRGLYSSR